MSKCLGKDRNNNPCRSNAQDGTQFCKNHQYMVDYTPEMLSALQLCKGCMKMYFFEGDIKQCASCKERGKESRAKAKENVVLCKSEGCKFKRSVENIYCGLHQLCLFVDECTAEGVRPCVKYLKGCRTKLGADYTNKSCQECLQKERERDKARRSAVSGEVVDGMKQCSVCCKTKPVSEYMGALADNQMTKTCRACRDEFQRQNEKRDMEHRREWQRNDSKKPERQAVKREWVEANPDKVALKHLNKRNRNYPETSDLTKEQFDNITKQPCCYCGVIQPRGFNGVDRVDSTRGYQIDNCVSCCTVCNLMKGAVDNITFIQRAEHILRHNSVLKDAKKYPEAFCDHIGSTYESYRYSAVKRGYEFEITKEDYYKLIQEDCYLCGKKTTETHQNGIDRFDNERGYTFHNSNACCGQCNLMKKEIDYQEFLDHLLKVYNYSSTKELKDPGVRITNILNRNIARLTRDERKAASESKK